MIPEFLTSQIKDSEARENFQKLNQYFATSDLVTPDWTFMTLDIKSAITNGKVPHGLKVRPLDLIQTSLIGAGSITWNYSLFDAVNLNYTTTGALVVRFFIGTFARNPR